MAVEFLIKNPSEHVTQHGAVRILITGDRALCRITVLQKNAQIPLLLSDLKSLRLWSLLNYYFLNFFFKAGFVL